MTPQEILSAFNSGDKLKWNDPEPIEGNDYTISDIIWMNEEMAMIHYNEGLSEAEVFTDEIELI